MLLSVHCISLRVVKYSDAQAIVTAWTRECGRMAFSVPWGASREAQRRRAMMMPLSLFEGVANVRARRDISTLSDVKASALGNASALDPVKNVMAMFLADFLYVVLRESQPDATLTDYIFDSVSRLSAMDRAAVANFHLYFIYHLGQMLGIAPDTRTYSPGYWFDMREGIFTASMPLHRCALDPQSARMVMILERLGPRSLHLLRLSREQRHQMLDGLLQYYDLHHAQVSALPSLQVLHTIFD